MSQEKKQTTQLGLTKEDLAFRRQLKKRMVCFIFLGLLGVFTLLLPAVVDSLTGPMGNPPSQQEMQRMLELRRRLNFFSGMGAALLGSSGVFTVRLYQTVNDPEKLRKSRIASNDERTQNIVGKARIVSGYVLLLVLYLGGIIGGIFYPVLHTVLAVLVMIYLASYCICYWIFNKRM